jgi:hypothetical protein
MNGDMSDYAERGRRLLRPEGDRLTMFPSLRMMHFLLVRLTVTII